MKIWITGAIEVRADDGSPVALQPLMQSLMATLIVMDRAVPADRLKQLLWDDAGVRDRSGSLANAISRLRGVLGDDRVQSTAAGYQLKLSKDDYVDLWVFRALLQRAQWARRKQDSAVEASLYEAALSKWGDPPLSGLPDTIEMRSIVDSLMALYRDTYEAYVEVRLALGQHRELAREIPVVLANDPLNEHLVGLLMRALYLSGRKAQALEAFTAITDRLQDEVGSGPGRSLQVIYEQVRRNDPVLTWQPPPPVAADARVLASGGDPTVPAHSGMMDYLLGGDFNTAADRAAVEKIRAVAPDIGEVVAENLAFYSRALRTVFKAGIEQVVELGIGMPCGDAAHHLARRVSPGTKVLYVSGDKPVATHAKSHLTGEATGIFYNDIREPHRIPEHPEARRLIDWDRPVAIVVRDVLNYLQCEDNPQYLLARLMKSASSGSYLIASNTTSESISDLLYEQLAHSFSNAGQKLVFRSQAEMESLFAGLTLLDPGVVGVHEWRPEKPTKPLPMQFLGGMAIKP